MFAHYCMHKHALSTLRKIKNPNHRASRGIKTNICTGICWMECIQKELATQSHEKIVRETIRKTMACLYTLAVGLICPQSILYTSFLCTTNTEYVIRQSINFQHSKSVHIASSPHTIAAYFCLMPLDFIQRSKETKTDVFARITINPNGGRERERQQKKCVL